MTRKPGDRPRWTWN